MTFGPAYDRALDALPDTNFETVATTDLGTGWITTDAATGVDGVRRWTVLLSDSVATTLRRAVATHHPDAGQALEHHHATCNAYRLTMRRTG